MTSLCMHHGKMAHLDDGDKNLAERKIDKNKFASEPSVEHFREDSVYREHSIDVNNVT